MLKSHPARCDKTISVAVMIESESVATKRIQYMIFFHILEKRDSMWQGQGDYKLFQDMVDNGVNEILWKMGKCLVYLHTRMQAFVGSAGVIVHKRMHWPGQCGALVKWYSTYCKDSEFYHLFGQQPC